VKQKASQLTGLHKVARMLHKYARAVKPGDFGKRRGSGAIGAAQFAETARYFLAERFPALSTKVTFITTRYSTTLPFSTITF